MSCLSNNGESMTEWRIVEFLSKLSSQKLIYASVNEMWNTQITLLGTELSLYIVGWAFHHRKGVLWSTRLALWFLHQVNNLEFVCFHGWNIDIFCIIKYLKALQILNYSLFGGFFLVRCQSFLCNRTSILSQELAKWLH